MVQAHFRAFNVLNIKNTQQIRLCYQQNIHSHGHILPLTYISIVQPPSSMSFKMNLAVTWLMFTPWSQCARRLKIVKRTTEFPKIDLFCYGRHFKIAAKSIASTILFIL